MKESEQLFFFLIALGLAFGVGCLGRNRKIGFGLAFLLAILNLFLGFIVVLCSKKKSKDIQFVDMEKKTEK